MILGKVDIWMPLYIDHYLGDTMHLTTVQHGAYLLLLMAYWKNKGPLPENRIESICKLNGDASSMLIAEIKRFFDLEIKPGFWTHHRVEKELKKAVELRQMAVERAKKGANARWKKDA